MPRPLSEDGGRRFIVGKEPGDARVEYEEGRRTFVSGEKAGDTRVEPREAERKETPPITVYYLRHGESSSDKTDPLRGLTEKGVEQVQEAIRRVSKEIEDKDTQIKLYSSGSERTRQQCIVAAEILHNAGFNNITIDENSLPQKGGERAQELGLHVEGPGVAKRVSELHAPKDYMAKLRQLESETGIGAVIHWMMDENLPEGAESAKQKAEVVENAVDITNRWAQHMKRDMEKGRDVRPMVALVFGHASALTAYGARAFEMNPGKLGEIENAEGIKMNFSGIAGQKPELQPFGDEIEKKVEKKAA